jgi:hypothetical protein
MWSTVCHNIDRNFRSRLSNTEWNEDDKIIRTLNGTRCGEFETQVGVTKGERCYAMSIFFVRCEFLSYRPLNTNTDLAAMLSSVSSKYTITCIAEYH